MPEPYGIALFCDDIRQEVGGKASYMGIYGTDMLINGPKPALLPKLAIAAHILIPVSLARGTLDVVVNQVSGETTQELIRMTADLTEVDEMPDGDYQGFFGANFHLNAVPFQILDDCTLKVRAYVAEKEIKLGGLSIRFGIEETSI
ncbi:hypothetical protein GHV40_14155 [Devosia sp. D6-9]|nr:hypothetical protein GHV40_14155 [Devosia sp. D6-9]